MFGWQFVHRRTRCGTIIKESWGYLMHQTKCLIFGDRLLRVSEKFLYINSRVIVLVEIVVY